jgi:hypothetical protein
MNARTVTRGVLGLAVGLLVLGVTPAAAQTAPPTLDGEILAEQYVATAEPRLEGTCNPDGSTTFTTTSTGVVLAGPYPGTYTEQVTATVGPQTGPIVPTGSNPIQGSFGFHTGTITQFDATFTITSGSTTITGTKHLDPSAVPVPNFPPPFTITDPSQQNTGFCGQVNGTNPPTFPPNSPPVFGYFRGIDAATVAYEAIIQTADGAFRDEGRTRVVIRSVCADFADDDVCTGGQNTGGGANVGAFGEVFASDLSAVEPYSTPGHVTGGGQVPSSTGAEHATFALNAKSDNKGRDGNCNVLDGSTTVRCLDVTALVQGPGTAAIFGHATVNGAAATYRIDVVDAGEPGTADQFRIVTSAGYAGGGVVTQGNVQVHD